MPPSSSSDPLLSVSTSLPPALFSSSAPFVRIIIQLLLWKEKIEDVCCCWQNEDAIGAGSLAHRGSPVFITAGGLVSFKIPLLPPSPLPAPQASCVELQEVTKNDLLCQVSKGYHRAPYPGLG